MGDLAGCPFWRRISAISGGASPSTPAAGSCAATAPSTTPEITLRYRATGVVLCGKTNTPEFGLTPFTEPELFGPTRNPWDPTRTVGGSSGGSAAAVAAGIVPMASGGDGGGSIRIPASCCGIFGLKPTRARTPNGPDVGELWRGAVVEHVLTRSVRDSAAMLDAIAGPDVGAPYYPPPFARPLADEVEAAPGRLRIAWTSTPFLGTAVHPDCERALADAVELLDSLGHELVPASPPIDGPAFARSFLTMMCAELNADVVDAEQETGRRLRRADVEAATWLLILVGQALRADELAVANRALDRQTRAIGGLFEDYDLLLTPTLASPPFAIGALQPTARERTLMGVLGRFGSGRLVRMANVLDELAGKVFEWIPYTPVFNMTGQPAMSVPLSWNEAGLPVGVQVVGRYADEATLIRLAGQLERARPWADRRPPLFGRAPEPAGPRSEVADQGGIR
ncbi:MAG: amidase [Gemmatimonadales bacterium]